MALSVVIPAYNEEEGIGATLAEVHRALTGLGDYEVVVVDDGSTDRTAEIAGRDARVIRHERNMGYGAAIKTGVAKCAYETICLLDADCTYPPSAIPSLLERFSGDGCIVSGSRFLGSNRGMPLMRMVGNTFFTNFASLLLMRRVSDISSGMKVFTRSTFNGLEPLPDTIDLMLSMTMKAVTGGLTFIEVPIDYNGRRGVSKLSVLRDGLRFFVTIVRCRLRG
jgi:glycosyltransferase involved in cell wall biosynthesis